MKDNNNNSKQVLLSVLGVAILVVAVVGVSFAAFSYSRTGEEVNTITTGTITMSYTDVSNGIELTNAMPMSNEQGKALTGENNVFDFNVSATISGSGTTQIDYAIIAAPEDGNTLKDNDIKVWLTNRASDTSGSDVGQGNTIEPKVLNTLPASSTTSATTGSPDSSDDYVLASGTFSGNGQTDNYRLRMWVDQNAPSMAGNVTDALSYQLRVNVYGRAAAQ